MWKDSVPLKQVRSRCDGSLGAESFPTSPRPHANTSLHCSPYRWSRMRVNVWPVLYRGRVRGHTTPQTFIQVFSCSSILHRKSLVAFPTIVDLLLCDFRKPLRILDFQHSLLRVFVEQLVLLVQILASFRHRGVLECSSFQDLHRPLVQIVDFGVGLRIFLTSFFYCVRSPAAARDPRM